VTFNPQPCTHGFLNRSSFIPRYTVQCSSTDSIVSVRCRIRQNRPQIHIPDVGPGNACVDLSLCYHKQRLSASTTIQKLIGGSCCGGNPSKPINPRWVYYIYWYTGYIRHTSLACSPQWTLVGTQHRVSRRDDGRMDDLVEITL